ncbi:hypothetical protein HYW11_03195 [Candidatus Peregrinibacteria bacterium]|nr:hypothetical protein [Candidatus Peregrinibacteria bacterium]
MSLFSYAAVNDRKERIQGMVDAMSLQAARSALQDTGLFVEEIHEAIPSECESAKPWETVAVTEQERCQVPGASFQEITDGRTPDGTVSQYDAELDEQQNLEAASYNLKPSYYPLLDTLRLYAGWLLAWYVLVIALGAYQETRHLPFAIPLVEGLWQSVLIIRAAFGVFLFLMLSSLYRFYGSRGWVGGAFGVVGALLFYVFLVNT